MSASPNPPVQQNPTRHVLPLIILFACLWTGFNNLFRSDVYSLISIAIGVTAVSLFYLGKAKYDKWMYAWIMMQLPNITYSDANIFNSFPMSVGTGMAFELRGGAKLSIYLNFLPIGLYLLYRYVIVEKPLGQRIVLKRLRKGSLPQIQFPVTGTIEKLAGRDKFNGVYLVRLDKEILINNTVYEYVFLQAKSGHFIDPSGQPQIAGLSICYDPNEIYSQKMNLFADWVNFTSGESNK